MTEPSPAPVLSRLASILPAGEKPASSTEPSLYDLDLGVLRQGFDGRTCMVQARVGIVPQPGRPPLLVATLSPLLLSGSDVYLGVYDMRSDDFGRTWSGPTEQPALRRRPDGEHEGRPVTLGGGDLWPRWHAASGKLLALGHTFRYADDKAPLPHQERNTCYTLYDPAAACWSPWQVLTTADGRPYPAGAGCVQWIDTPDGSILLPLTGGARTKDSPFTHVRVVKLRFDGHTLTVLEEGAPLHQPSKRGLTEPSLTFHAGRYFLTIRHDERGYVCTSPDGLHFDPPRPWLWDDGSELGTYNTQSHWVTHDQGLFLVYTRRGADNDHVFRHRAPLFIAQVDPQTLRVIRATERIAVPQRGARMGNFGITPVSPHETWIVTSEWMQTWKGAIIPLDNPYGADNRTYAARVLWREPNRGWQGQ